jgi:hypothetical protein
MKRSRTTSARASHLELHLVGVFGGHGLAEKRFQMRCRIWALDLDQAVRSDQAIGAGTSLVNLRMRHERNLLDRHALVEAVGIAGLGLGLGPVLHRRVAVGLGRSAGQALGDELGEIVGA